MMLCPGAALADPEAVSSRDPRGICASQYLLNANAGWSHPPIEHNFATPALLTPNSRSIVDVASETRNHVEIALSAILDYQSRSCPADEAPVEKPGT
jgi:hypothetical protein